MDALGSLGNCEQERCVPMQSFSVSCCGLKSLQVSLHRRKEAVPFAFWVGPLALSWNGGRVRSPSGPPALVALHLRPHRNIGRLGDATSPNRGGTSAWNSATRKTL